LTLRVLLVDEANAAISALLLWSFSRKIPSFNCSLDFPLWRDLPPDLVSLPKARGERWSGTSARPIGNKRIIFIPELNFMKTVVRFLLLFVLPSLLFSQSPGIEYKLGMSKPWTHLLEVEFTVKGVPSSPASLDFLMPVWRTGRYVIFNFASGVQGFSATDGNGNPCRWSKTDKSTWRVEKGSATTCTVRYMVYANEIEQRTRGLNDEHAFIDGCAVFMYIQAFRNLPLTLTVVPYQDWHVTTGLEAMPGEKFKFRAPNYDILVDSPLEIGTQKDVEFEIDGKKHVLSIFGPGNYDVEKMIPDMTKLVNANKEFWGELPYDRYVFLLHLGVGGGATEHMNSMIMQTGSYGFRNPDSYRGFLGLVSHEFFHTWNVKRLRPKGILPYDFTKENYAKELWVAEGTTSYYGQMLVLRAGFGNNQLALDWLAGTVQYDRQRPGNKVQSVVDASFDSWVKGGQQSYNFESDIYGKGAVVSCILDLEIRQHSNNKYSLDDVMRTLYKRFPLSSRGYTVDDLRSTAEKFAGTDLKKFFDDYVAGTVPIPWEQYFGYAGLSLQAKDSDRKISIGIMTADHENRTSVMGVTAESPAYDAGVDIGDEVVALNGLRVRTSDLNDRLADYKPGDKVKLTVFRRGRLREFEITLRLQDVPSYKVSKVDQPTPLQKSIFESWLKTN
jgi:predicted metalloprotease with PDZ domain